MTSIAPVIMQESKNSPWGGNPTFYNMDSGKSVSSGSYGSFKSSVDSSGDSIWGSGFQANSNSKKNRTGDDGNNDNLGFGVTMQDLIDCIVDESMRRPTKESSYIRTSETMFRKMLSGERSWNINSCGSEPCADYQSRLENLAVLNNLIISMESKSAASKSDKMGDTMVSQMKTRFANTPGPSSANQGAPVKQPPVQVIPALSPPKPDNSFVEEQISDVFTDFPVRSSSEAQTDSSGKMDYDSSSSAERSPEMTSDSGSSLCNKCRSLKLGERCSCPDLISRSSPSSSSQGSCESRNASPPSKSSAAGSTRKNSDGSSTDDSYSGCTSSQTKLPPPPPLIAVTCTSKPGVWDSLGPAAPVGWHSLDRQSGSSSSSREEIKHPKKRIKDRHFRETNGGDYSDSSGSGSSDSNGNSSDSQQSNNFPQNLPQYQTAPRSGHPLLFPNVPIVNTFGQGIHPRRPYLREPNIGAHPPLQTQSSFGENLFRPFNELTLFGTLGNPATTQVFMLPNVQHPPINAGGLQTSSERTRYPLLQSICQAETTLDSSRTNFSSTSRYF